jgi:glycosyltransferase 2 family protein
VRAPAGLAVGGLLGLVVGVVALGLAVKDVDTTELGAAFARAGVAPLLLGTLCHLAVIGLYGARWRVLLDKPAPLPLPRITGLVGLGYLANYTLPARPGELVRAGLARALGGVPLTLALASLFLEKVLDGLTILASSVGFVFLLPQPADWLWRSTLVGAGVFAVGAVMLLVSALLPRRLVPSFVRTQLDHVAAPIRLLAAGRALLPVVGLGAAIWLTILLHQAVLCLGAGMSFQPAAWLLMYGALGLASVVPGAPGYVGTYQLAAVYALGVFDVPPETAIVVATYYQLSRLVGALVVGSWSISREGMGALRRAIRSGRSNA